MVETSQPFDPSTPCLGVSAVGPWIVFVAAVIPSPPHVRLGLALAAATTWPVAYWINAARFGFATESWRHASIWPAMNYLFALVAYLLTRVVQSVRRLSDRTASAGTPRTPERPKSLAAIS